MARYTKGALGAFSGKLGNVVGSNWRSIDYLRSLPKPSRKPASPLQLAQRMRFSIAVGFLQPIKDILNIGFSDASLSRTTGYNQGVKSMLKNAVVGEYPDFDIDFQGVELSRGSLAGLVNLSIAEDEPYTLSVSWTSLINRFNSFLDDDVLVLLYNKTKKLFTVYEDVTRGEEEVRIELSESFKDDELVCWTFLVKRDGDTTSNSQYAGMIVVEGAI